MMLRSMSPRGQNLRSPAAVLRFAGTCIVGLSIDLWTKSLAVAHFKGTGDYYVVASKWLQFEYTENHGAVFGIGQGQRALFVVVSIFATALLTYLFANGSRKWFPQIVLGLLLAGVLGNLYDRVTLGYVRDMIHAFPDVPNPLRGQFPAWQEVFPWIFNVADSMLCVGVGLTVIMSFFQPPPEPAAPESPADDAAARESHAG